MPLSVVATGTPVVGATLTASILSTPTPTPEPSAGRFFTGYEWRFVFTDLNCAITTFAEGLCKGRKVVLSLGQAETIEGDINPDDSRVNDIWDDGYPKVAPSKRLVFAFRRDNPTGVDGPPWVARAAGILMAPDDSGDVDVPLSHFIAYGPRKLLDARPVMNLAGALPDPDDGFNYLARTGDSIVTEMLKATIINEGGVFIDAGPDFGGTVYWSGTIETTDVVTFTAQQGQMIGDAWNQLEDTGNLDIILTPIYDPIRRPGFTHELSVFRLAGSVRSSAVFGWDRMNNSIAHIERVHDATPGSFFNKVWYHAGSGGPGVPLLGPSAASGTINEPSVLDFGVYWAQQFFPSLTSIDPSGAAVLALAQQAIKMARQGKRTLTINPIPERAKIPIVQYGIGDRVPVYASRRLRVVSEGLQRVQSIPFDISDDGVETVSGFITSPDWRAEPVVDPMTQGTIRVALASIQPQTGRPAARPSMTAKP